MVCEGFSTAQCRTEYLIVVPRSGRPAKGSLGRRRRGNNHHAHRLVSRSRWLVLTSVLFRCVDFFLPAEQLMAQFKEDGHEPVPGSGLVNGRGVCLSHSTTARCLIPHSVTLAGLRSHGLWSMSNTASGA